VFFKNLGSEPIEPPLSDILLELPIPSLPIVFSEPVAEGSQLLRREILNFLLECLNSGHDGANCNSGRQEYD
jgi:hypothetical protein